MVLFLPRQFHDGDIESGTSHTSVAVIFLSF
jgi:hypothetical protein